MATQSDAVAHQKAGQHATLQQHAEVHSDICSAGMLKPQQPCSVVELYTTDCLLWLVITIIMIIIIIVIIIIMIIIIMLGLADQTLPDGRL